jgi:hypothetical protein
MIGELVPRVAAVIEDVRIGFEHAIRQPVVTHELPNILNGVEFWAFRRQRNQRYVLRNDKALRHMPPRLIEDEHRVRAWTDLLRDLSEMQAHRSAVASRHDEPRTLAITRTDRAEDVGGGGPLIVWGRRPRPTPRPAPRNLVLLPDACFVRKPHLYVGCSDPFLLRDLLQAAGKAFLKSSTAPSACA